MQQLEMTAEKYDKMKEFYDKKMSVLSRQVRETIGERDQLLEAIAKIESLQPQQSTEELRVQRDRLKKRLRNKEVELERQRAKLTELQRFEKMKAQSRVALQRANNELESMKQRRVSVMKQLETTKREHREQLKDRQRQINRLKRITLKREKEITKLSSKTAMQERQLHQRAAKVAQAQPFSCAN